MVEFSDDDSESLSDERALRHLPPSQKGGFFAVFLGKRKRTEKPSP
jgi:hypothetical protein